MIGKVVFVHSEGRQDAVAKRNEQIQRYRKSQVRVVLGATQDDYKTYQNYYRKSEAKA